MLRFLTKNPVLKSTLGNSRSRSGSLFGWSKEDVNVLRSQQAWWCTYNHSNYHYTNALTTPYSSSSFSSSSSSSSSAEKRNNNNNNSNSYSNNNGSGNNNNNYEDEKDLPPREEMEFDVVIVGGGPAGLSTAIRLKQLAKQYNQELEVAVVEKGPEIGSHILSGNVFNPIALNELIPDWKSREAPLSTHVTKDEFWFLTPKSALRAPFIPKLMRNDENYIISLGDLCRWLSQEAEALDVMILPGFSVKSTVMDEQNRYVCGVVTNDSGRLKDGSPGPSFTRGSLLKCKQVVLAEGCRGSVSEQVMAQYNLRAKCEPQMYAIGYKEVWQHAEKPKHPSGLVIHGLGWPLGQQTYSGMFLYTTDDYKVYMGLVVGLEYENPYLNPYMEFQRLKTHPKVRPFLEGAECIGYGARTLNEGGYQSVPKVTFPGGVLVGCSAGFVNVPKVKGSHYAMKSGMIAAEEIFQSVFAPSSSSTASNSDNQYGVEVTSYEDKLRKSWIMNDLHAVRNIHPGYKYGLIPGMAYSAFSVLISKGREFWTMKHGHTCAESTKPKKNFSPIQYDKPDGKLTFDILTNVQRTGTNHDEDEPSHLIVKPELKHMAEKDSWDVYGGPESRFCPAKVYEFVEQSDGEMKLVINSQNCIHCKACSIKTPGEYIRWTVPQGGGGPKYGSM